jgi:hypothetical protein
MKIANIPLAIVVALVAALPTLAAKRTVASPFSQDLLPLLPYLTLSPTLQS